MRVAVTAMGGLVPEHFMLVRELSRRFDRVSVLVGPEQPSLQHRLCTLGCDGVELGHWRPTELSADVVATLTDADAVVHVPPRGDEEHRTPPAVTLESIDCVAHAISRRPSRVCSFLSLIRADGRELPKPTALLSNAGVRACVARFGVVLRAPAGVAGRMLCAFRAQGASTRAEDRASRVVGWIHVLDGVRAVAHVLANDSLSGRIELMAPERVSVDHFAGAVWSAYGLPRSLRGPAAGVGRLLGTPLLDGAPAATADRLVQSGFSYLFPDLTSALQDIAHPSKA